VFEERAAEIVSLLSKAVNGCGALHDWEPLDDPEVDLSTYAGVIKAQLAKLPEAMTSTRRVLSEQLGEIKERRRDIKRLMKDLEMMDVSPSEPAPEETTSLSQDLFVFEDTPIHA
jgi:hypothetical protein